MGKSPYASPKTETYAYPAPLDAPLREGETEVSHQTRLDAIDPDEVGENHWIKIRIPKSRGDVDAVADATQSMLVLGGNGGSLKYEQAIVRGNQAVFAQLVEGWSFEGEPSAANYARLDGWSGEWVSACLADAVRQGTTRDFAKKTGNSSSEPEPSVNEPSSPEPVASDSPSRT